MKRKWLKPTSSFVAIDLRGLEDVKQLSDIEIGEELEKRGYKFRKKYQASPNYIHKKIADADVLIAAGANSADFNGYIEIGKSAVMLWETMQTPCELKQLERVLEEAYHISHEAAAAEVFEFVNFLLKKEMLLVS